MICLRFFYQIPSRRCMSKLTTVMPIQQKKPRVKGFPPVLINLTILVFKPTAVIASTMKNLLNVFNGVNMSADTPTDVATVVMTDASTK